jgi:hypothetical protein
MYAALTNESKRYKTKVKRNLDVSSAYKIQRGLWNEPRAVAGTQGDYCGRQRATQARFFWTAQVARGLRQNVTRFSRISPEEYVACVAQNIRLLISTPTFRFEQSPSMVLASANRWNFWQHRKAFCPWWAAKKYQDRGELDRRFGKGPEEVAQRFQQPHPVPNGTDTPQIFVDQLYEIYYRFLETEDEYFAYAPAPVPPQGRWRINRIAGGNPEESLLPERSAAFEAANVSW